jgi:hypothetical protein
MNILADEGVDKPIIDALRRFGIDVKYILETNQGAEDKHQKELINSFTVIQPHAIRIRK